jgi:hypothetical protein
VPRVYIPKIREPRIQIPVDSNLVREDSCLIPVPAKSSKESMMRKRTNCVRFIAAIVVLAATLTLLGNAAAQKASVPKPQNKLAMGEDDVRHLLPLMDADKNGMVSKQEFMKYMEAQFERLDKKKIGQLNVKELTQSSLSASHFVGK